MRSAVGRLGIVWLTTALCGCQVSSAGEWDERACHNHQDDDGDGLIDCADPDCWLFSCAEAGVANPDGGADAALPASDAALPPRDAGAAGADAQGQDLDAGPEPSDDASVPPAECDAANGCPGAARCVDGVCVEDGLDGAYDIQILSAVVPSRDRAGVCYDVDVTCSVLTRCGGPCQPDPMVSIVLNSVTTVGTTGHVLDTLTPQFDDAPFRVTLRASDQLEFVVRDWDALLMPKIFSCYPQLSMLPTGMLQCQASSDMTVPPADDGPYGVVARVTRVAPPSP